MEKKEKKTIKIDLWIFYVMVAAMVVLVAAVVIGWTNVAKLNNVKNEDNQANTQSQQSAQNTQTNEIIAKQDEVKELDVNSELVQKLYGYVADNERTKFDPNTYLSFYRSEKVTSTTLEDDIKLLTVFMSLIDDKNYTIIKNDELKTQYIENLGNCKTIDLSESYFYDFNTKQWVKKDKYTHDVLSDVYVFSNDSIQKRAKEIFNTSINIQKHSFEMLAEGLFYDDNTYKYFQYVGGGDYPFVDTTKIIKAEKKTDELYIYDNFIRYYWWTDGTIYATSNEKFKLMNKYEGESKPDLSSLNIILPIYKHTFKQRDDGTYYWVSTELTNKDKLNIVQ